MNETTKQPIDLLNDAIAFQAGEHADSAREAALLRIGLDELIVDSFAGGGGASVGIEMALGRSPDIAINHNAQALAMHATNHPSTKHYQTNVWDVDPAEVCAGRKVGLLWLSPDCTFHSKARGGKPFRDRNKARRRRGLAWIAVAWAKAVRPRVIALENVEEFQHWGPLGTDGKPCPLRKGFTFRRFVRSLENCGYVVDFRELSAHEYGAPTIRKRLFMVARCDGQPIVWPAETHGPGLLPYRTAAECIDWTLPCPSIFERAKPLAENTLRRIARGIKKYVLDARQPFIVPLTHQGDARTHGLDDPMPTVTGAHRGEHALACPLLARIGQTGGNGAYVDGVDEPVTTVTTKAEHLLVTPFMAGLAHGDHAERPGSRTRAVNDPVGTIHASGGNHALVSPTLIQTGYGERPGQAPRVPGLEKPLGTVVAGGAKHALVAAFMAQHNGGDYVQPGRRADAPLSTLTNRGTQQQLVAAVLSNQYSSNTAGGQGDASKPVRTITARGTHQALVHAFLMRFYSEGGQWSTPADPMATVTCKDRMAVVQVNGEPHVIADIGMRMLQPRELFRAQGFPDTYVIDRTADGTPLTKTDQVSMCGNSVCPPLAAAIVRAQFADVERQRLLA